MIKYLTLSNSSKMVSIVLYLIQWWVQHCLVNSVIFIKPSHFTWMKRIKGLELELAVSLLTPWNLVFLDDFHQQNVNNVHSYVKSNTVQCIKETRDNWKFLLSCFAYSRPRWLEKYLSKSLTIKLTTNRSLNSNISLRPFMKQTYKATTQSHVEFIHKRSWAF